MFHQAWKPSVVVPAGTATVRLIELSRSSPAPLYQLLLPAYGGALLVTTCFLGSGTTMACGLLELYSSGPMLITVLLPLTATS